MAKAPTTKPFHLVDRKTGPKNTVSETDICQFTQILLTNIRLHEHWRVFLEPTTDTWGTSRVENRGFEGADARTNAARVDAMLAYVASYSPKHLLREITERSESLKDVWKLLRKWAGV